MATVSPALTTFQYASTALTVALREVPAVCVLGLPVLPVDDPGAAVSPGRSSCSFVKLAAFTPMVLEFAVFVPSVTSDAVTLRLPAVLSVTLNVADPAESAAFDGRTAFVSDDVIPTVSPALTLFQYASTALTVTLKAEPAACVVGVPVFPVALPAPAVSP